MEDSKFLSRTGILPLLVLIIVLVAGATYFFVVESRKPSADVLATVNGEPIFLAEVESAIALIPAAFHSPDAKESILNQTIDLLLLRQDAARRAITVSQADIDTAIDVILNDTGRSRQELRLILAAQNLSVPDFEMTVADMLIAERVVRSAVSNRITITEQDILLAYNRNQADFAPALGGARINHILLETDEDAREVIARLNRGESFRMLAEEVSLDGQSSSQGGSIGIIDPRSPVETSLRDAALALAENQYSRVPVRTAAGYHVLLRDFDIPSIQELQATIRQQLRQEREQELFKLYLDELRTAADIRVRTAEGFVKLDSPNRSTLAEFTLCVAAKSVVYFEGTNSASTQRQLEVFGTHAMNLSTINCSEQPVACSAAGITQYPSWLIDRSVYTGILTRTELSQRTGCSL